MNMHRVLRTPRIEWVMVVLSLFVVGGLALLISVAWPLIHAPSSQATIPADPLEVVRVLHSSINSNDANALLDLFAEDAVVTVDGSVFEGKDAIRYWVLHSKRMSGLHLRLIDSQVAGEKVFWYDLADNGPGIQDRSYVLRWMAVVQKGKIKSLTVSLMPMPDGK